MAILFALLVPRGIWGTIEGRFGIQLMPVGYRVRGLGVKKEDKEDTPDTLLAK